MGIYNLEMQKRYKHLRNNIDYFKRRWLQEHVTSLGKTHKIKRNRDTVKSTLIQI